MNTVQYYFDKIGQTIFSVESSHFVFLKYTDGSESETEYSKVNALLKAI